MPLLDRGWQLKMLEFREKHSLEGAIRRLRKNSTMASHPTHPMAPFDMFNDVQDHVLKTAQTHIDRIVMEAFVAGVDRFTDPGTKQLMDTLCDLFALTTIEADKAWFLEHGQLTPARAKLLTGTVNQLLKDLRPHMTTLVDAFAIPAAWKATRILEEEADRQQAMADRDAELRVQNGEDTVEGTATDLAVAPAQ